jgi:hypothetical protein
MTDDRKLTLPQLRALAWLPIDGSWRMWPGRAFFMALNSLHHYNHDVAEREYGNYGPAGGLCWRYRLTPAGIELKKQRSRCDS